MAGFGRRGGDAGGSFFSRAGILFITLVNFSSVAAANGGAPVTDTSSVDADSVGRPWGRNEGLLQFRGNPTRTFYGTGPIPRSQPRVLWRYPDRPMCAASTVGNETKTWCGTGWTGQPAVWKRPDGITEVIVGAYDRRVHFIDAETGRATRPPFATGDIIKGSVTIDPDGYPLLYFGSRDNKLRIVALDRPTPTELWSLDANAVSPKIWNDDWDGNPAIVNDVPFEGGENGWFFAIKLNRGRDRQGFVSVAPQSVVEMPGWNDALLRDVGDRMASIESSVAVFGSRVYFANSAGRIVGIDMNRIGADKKAEIVFDFWAGDDIDATLVIDEHGHLYVAAELERLHLRRPREVGQLFKLDPYASGNPILWSVEVPVRAPQNAGGLWATPALDLRNDRIYAPTHSGDLLAVDRKTGRVVWTDSIGNHAWSSPALVDDVLLVGRCSSGGLRAYDVSGAGSRVLWNLNLPSGGCIESTPAVWGGRIYVGSRDGFIYAFGP